MREVGLRREWHMVNGRRHWGKRKQPSAIAGTTWLMVIVFAATLGWLNRDAILPQVAVNADATALDLADVAAQARAQAQSAALNEDPYAYADAPSDVSVSSAAISISFGLCHTGGGRNCVVDGDTFWLNGEKIRIADIDTPETHPPRCAAEAALGEQATQRLRTLLNAGPISLAANPGGNSHDRYGRRLAVVERDGQSIGMMLVGEGLARPYAGGQRAGWC